MKIKALLVAAVLAGEFGLCFASTDGDLIQGVIPYPDSVSVTSVVIEPFHPEIERHTEGFNSGFKPLCLKITRVREAQGASWVTQTNVKPSFSERLVERQRWKRRAGANICFIRTEESSSQVCREFLW